MPVDRLKFTQALCNQIGTRAVIDYNIDALNISTGIADGTGRVGGPVFQITRRQIDAALTAVETPAAPVVITDKMIDDYLTGVRTHRSGKSDFDITSRDFVRAGLTRALGVPIERKPIDAVYRVFDHRRSTDPASGPLFIHCRTWGRPDGGARWPHSRHSDKISESFHRRADDKEPK